ncbi:MAG: DUF11 domain-containing protein [Anaerolineales bacterium]|nr:DUF11 domain-containing protein [Anaerolineales bacterium]
MPAGGGTGACSDATGHFTVRGLAYGEYIVNAGGSWNYCAEQPGTHAREYYDGVYLEDDATLVAVSSALSQVVDINFNLDTGGFISGHVEDDTGAPLQDFWVELYLPTGQCPDCTNWYDDSFTDENGDYTLGPLPELDFGVYACADCNGLLLVNEYYNNVYSFIDADLVHVISGTTISNINFHMDAGILLTGTVSVPTGYSAENLRVNVWRDDAPDYWATTNTDSAGLYQIPVPPIYDREWVVRVRPLGTDLESKWARYFDIAAQTQWDFDLEAGGVITGIITSGGVPVSGAWVNAHSDWIGNGDDSDSNGYYRIENLPPGKYYVSADGWPDYAYNDYDTGYPWWSSLAVILERGETRGGINIDVGEISQIEGYVYEADGSTPVEGARISAMNDSQVYFGYSQSDGYFSVDVAAGDYRVYFDRGFEWEDGADIVPVYYPGASQWKNAAWVAAPAFGSIAINQNVQRPASLSGQVTENGSGNPLGGIHIAVQNIDPSVDREAAWWTCTDENGEYTIDGIWPGQTLVTAIGTCGNYNYEEITSTLAIVAGGNHNLNLGMSAGPPPERPFTMRTYDYSKTDYSAYAFGGAILSWDAAPILKALYSPLAQLNNRGEWVSDLLTSIPTVENGGAAIIGDQLYVTYTLKTGLLWSDGAALESYDIRFTWEKLIQAHPLVDDPWYTDYADLFKIENILTPNAQTAVVIYKPKYILPGYLETITYLLPEHTLAGEHPADVVFYSHFAHYPVSNGPYIVEKWVPGSHLDLRANPNYHASGSGLPLIREMRILFTGDPWDGLVNGFVDLGLDMAWYAPEDYQSYNLAAYHGFWNYFDALVPNTDLPFFADTQVRQALYHALDRQAFVDSYPPMQFSVGHSYLPPCNPMYTTTFSTYEFNLPLAATVLDSAGWVDSNGNGVRDKDGVEFEFDLGYLELSTERQKMAAIFQEDLASIGVDANLVPIPQSQINITRRFFLVDAYLQGWGFDNHFDPMAYELFHSSRVPSPYNSYRGSIFTGLWIDPAQDSLLESLVHELDFDRLKDAYADHLSLSSQQLPILPWRQWNQLDLSTPVLLNFKPGSTAIPTWNIAEWWVPPNPYDLSVRKALAADSPAPQPGSIITYEISVRNLGYFSMTSAALIDTLPEQVVYLGASPPPDAITDTRTMRWDLGDILGKSTHSPIKVAVQIPPTVTHGTWLTNSVQVSADQPDNHPGNNGFTHLAQVRDDVDLAVSKYGVGQPAIGEHFDYYINYGNWGGAPAANAVISDTLPPEVNLLSTSRIPSSSDGRTLTWNLGTLPGNQWGGQIKLTAEITQTGTVTNLAQISSSDPDVDLANNEEDHIEYVDDILKPVILRPTSGTTDGTPTVSGLAPSGSLVEIYDLASVMMAEQMNLPVAVQATLLYSTTAGSSGTFSVELSLAEGTYILAAKATKADLTSDYSNNVAIVVDHSLPLDPDMITISADGVDLSNGCVRADRHVLAYRLLDITAVLNCPSMPNNVRLQITENGLFTYYIGPSNLTSLGGGQWQVNFHAWLGEPHSSYEIRLLWECQGSAKSVLLLYILIDPDGYLYDQSLTDAGSAITDSLILNGVVTAYVKIADDWQAWPANIYGQVNPQFTDDATDDGVLTPGYYSFLTPSGKYRIEASAPGYQPYQSEVLTVITTPVHLNIPLQPVTGGSGFAKSPANLNGSSKVVNKTGDELTYDIWLANSGDEDTNSLSLQDFIPANTQYVDGSLTCSSGDADYDSGSGKIWWQGEVSGKQTVHIQYKLRVVSIPAYPLRPFTIVNTAQVSGSYVDTYLLPELTATVSIDIFDIYLPLIKK